MVEVFADDEIAVKKKRCIVRGRENGGIRDTQTGRFVLIKPCVKD